MVSFIAERNKFASLSASGKCSEKARILNKGYRYRTRELPGFKHFEGRLVVDWGVGHVFVGLTHDRQGDKEDVDSFRPTM